MISKAPKCEKCGKTMIFVTLPRPELGLLSGETGYRCLYCEPELIKKAEKEDSPN